MDSICNLIPAKSSSGDLKTVHFVYECELKKLKQPFFQPIYYMYLVTHGSGTLKLDASEHALSVGSLFFTFPGNQYEIIGTDDLFYMYISFMGNRATELIEELRIDMCHPVYNGFVEEISFWKCSIQRITQQNANILTESVLFHTLSLINNGNCKTKSNGNMPLKNIINYIDNHYFEPDISLKKVANIFSYTDKYLSHLFKTSMNINWNVYLNQLRIQHAIELIERGFIDVYELATACGYSDPMYFSKVFKKFMSITPRAYIEQHLEKKLY